MADLTFPTWSVGSAGFIQGRGLQPFTQIQPAPGAGRLRGDRRLINETTGVISDQVVLKVAGIDVPFVNGRVWLLRLADGFKAWEGWSDADGYYTASGLEVGVEYVAVGIDQFRNQKATGAGPVMATVPE